MTGVAGVILLAVLSAPTVSDLRTNIDSARAGTTFGIAITATNRTKSVSAKQPLTFIFTPGRYSLDNPTLGGTGVIPSVPAQTKKHFSFRVTAPAKGQGTYYLWACKPYARKASDCFSKMKPITVTNRAVPADVLDLSNWKLTLPIGDPDEIKQPELRTYSQPTYFHLNAAGTGVVFRAHAGGATTSNSGYPRSELREMNGSKKAAWDSAKGTHTMRITQAITHLPSAKPHVVAGQIHDDEDDVVMVRLEGKKLFVEADGDEVGVLNPDYRLGTPFHLRMKADANGIRVAYDEKVFVDLPRRTGDGWYFKAGCYTQSNEDKGDKPDAFGEVVITALSVQHS